MTSQQIIQEISKNYYTKKTHIKKLLKAIP